MTKINGLPLLTGPMYAPDGTEVADWWELAEWFHKYESSLWRAANDMGEVPLKFGSPASRLRHQASGYRDVYEAMRRIAEHQIYEESQ